MWRRPSLAPPTRARDLAILAIHLIATVAKLLLPGGARYVATGVAAAEAPAADSESFTGQGTELRPIDRHARVFGFSLERQLQEAGRAQNLAGTSQPAWGEFARLFNPWGGKPPYGDDPQDQQQISNGADSCECMSR